MVRLDMVVAEIEITNGLISSFVPTVPLVEESDLLSELSWGFEGYSPSFGDPDWYVASQLSELVPEYAVLEYQMPLMKLKPGEVL
ncbi:MAG: hypothetical protein KJ556_21615 [Gammaproteobacteria bacterium]|nr:hypothetical protein [Gammaproteobacteria bacterium]